MFRGLSTVISVGKTVFSDDKAASAVILSLSRSLRGGVISSVARRSTEVGFSCIEPFVWEAELEIGEEC
jgi:hypothetical protein